MFYQTFGTVNLRISGIRNLVRPDAAIPGPAALAEPGIEEFILI